MQEKQTVEELQAHYDRLAALPRRSNNQDAEMFTIALRISALKDPK